MMDDKEKIAVLTPGGPVIWDTKKGEYEMISDAADEKKRVRIWKRKRKGKTK